MRYIYYIVFIILLTTFGAWGLGELLSGPPEGETLLRVNGRTISSAELENRRKYSPYYFRSNEEFINDLIIRELLIQEAVKQGIDREEPFRMAMENHYEQALIKHVMDRKLAEIDVVITDQELAHYRRQAGLHYQLEQVLHAHPSEDESGKVLLRKEIDEDFLNLPVLWQMQLLSLGEDMSCKPFPMDNNYCVLNVRKTTPLHTTTMIPDDAEIRETLQAARRQLSMEQWLDDLRRRAKVNISAALHQEGGQG